MRESLCVHVFVRVRVRMRESLCVHVFVRVRVRATVLMA